MKTTSDPFCEIVAISAESDKCCRQVTSVCKETLHPFWDETFEVPVACVDDALLAGVNSIAEGFSSEAFIETLLPPLVDLQGQTGGNLLERTEKRAEDLISKSAHSAFIDEVRDWQQDWLHDIQAHR